jgi:plastocyanin
VRLCKRHLPFIALLCGVILAMLPSLASSATTASVEALNEGGGIYGETHRWSPTPAEVTRNGGVVTFSNKSALVPHGVVWQSTPAKPSCEEGAGKVPVGVGHSGYSWSGACTFTQEGTYTYYCSVHGAAMSGTIYVNANGTLPPTATTEAATPISETAATLRGNVNPEGQPTSYYFNYGTSTAYGEKTSPASVGTDSAGHALSAPIAGLLPGTLYHFQVVAVFASGESSVFGADRTFTTLSPPGAPTASTGEATPVGETEATLRGTVNPNGEATTYFFNYGTTSNYGHTTSVLSAGADNVDHAISAVLSGLAPGTLYHFELVAHNNSGDAPGADRTFTTASPSPLPPPPPPPPPTTTTARTPTPQPIASAVTSPLPSSAASLGFTGGSPFAGSASAAIKISSAQHGSSVHGVLDIAPAGAGARLEVDLLAASASLARRHAKQVRIGRFLRVSLAAGKLSFSVPLNAQAKRALRRHHRLPVIVQITITPLHGAPVTVMRSVTLHG